MSLKNENFHKNETDILQQIAIASDAIRRKHKLIKLGKEAIEQTLNNTFKPIVTPLEKIVDGFKIRETVNSVEKVQSEDIENIYDNDDNDDDHDGDVTFMSATDERVDEREDSNNSEFLNVNDTENNKKTSSTSWDDNIKHYLILLGERSKELDNISGVRKLTKDRLMIGDSPINFSQDYIHVGDSNFQISKGLLELLFKKIPEESLISSDDLENYRKIILATNAHKKHYKAANEVRDSKSFKYKHFIEKIILTSPARNNDRRSKRQDISGRGMIPQYMVAKEGNQLDYIYWDDPNELVDRLRLLLASQAAGNSSHTNEIISIVEELREAGIIY